MFYNDSSMLYWLRVAMSTHGMQQPTQAALYQVLEAYYWSNGLYDQIKQALYEKAIWTEGMKPLRNPAHRVVEFYVSKLWPGQLPDALPIQTKNQGIVDPIQQVWKWSNWGSKKQLAARWLALFGDLFIKVVTADGPGGDPERVYFQLIKPAYVTDLDSDDRGYLQFIRFDIPQVERGQDGSANAVVYTEVWDKDRQDYRTWTHTRGLSARLQDLGTPKTSAQFQDLGIDFIPVVHGKFQDMGDTRGAGAFVHALDKIDEANRQATRLHQMLFRYNKPIMTVSAGGLDPTGRPLPAPRLNTDPTGQNQANGDSTLKDDSLLYLPGVSSLGALVPSLDYSAALEILQAQIGEIEKDLPELAYYRLPELGGADISGRALSLMLSAANDRVIEVRGNAESALVRANQMALTIGQAAGLFSNVGNYQAGELDHTIAPRDVFPMTESERAEIAKNYTTAGVPVTTAVKRVGWSEQDIKDLEKAQDKETQQQQESFGQALLTQARSFDQGKNPGQPAPAGKAPAGQPPAQDKE